MAIAVLIQARIHAEHVSRVLATLREQIEPPAHRAAGRLRERIFQRLGPEHELLSLSQWESPDAFDAASATLRDDLVANAAREPLRTHHLLRLLTFERPLQRADVTACALIVPTRGDSPAVRERVVQDRDEIRDAAGLISHEIYVTSGPPTMYVSIHSWRRLSDLQRFRAEVGTVNELRLGEVGATLDRFNGVLVAEYPLLSSKG